MRVALIGLGIITVALAVVLAGEHLWWIAVPDAAFGVAVGVAAWQSLMQERNTRTAGLATGGEPVASVTPPNVAPRQPATPATPRTADRRPRR